MDKFQKMAVKGLKNLIKQIKKGDDIKITNLIKRVEDDVLSRYHGGTPLACAPQIIKRREIVIKYEILDNKKKSND